MPPHMLRRPALLLPLLLSACYVNTDRAEPVATGILGYRIDTVSMEYGYRAKERLLAARPAHEAKRRADMTARAAALCPQGFVLRWREMPRLKTTAATARLTEVFVVSCTP